MTTLNEVLDAVMGLPAEQQEMLVQIVRQRTIENCREEIAQAAEAPISKFRSGKFKFPYIALADAFWIYFTCLCYC